jgi:phosphopantothenoylcysteine decarboxylase/phosphopantothenate--cysteine ligase
VADYRPVETQGTKIKKSEEQITLKLIRNPDIVSLVAAAANGPFTVGFAAETNDVLSYARDKMQRKGLDMIIANDVSDRSIGFNSDDNEVTVLWPGGESVLARAGKDSIARHIVELIAQRLTGSH